MALTWAAPLDRGVGEGVGRALLGYDVAVYAYAQGGTPGAAPTQAIQVADGATILAISALQAGSWYAVLVQDRKSVV